jgi:heme-degrading monooxygenase HmoA
MDQGKLWQGGSDVFARVSTFRGDPAQIDQGINYIRESVLPSVRPDERLEGFYHLVDRQSGKAISITLWESEEAMRATEEEANELRAEIANAANATIESVETYEVGVSPGQR